MALSPEEVTQIVDAIIVDETFVSGIRAMVTTAVENVYENAFNAGAEAKATSIVALIEGE
jgi:hypothetical protein